MARELLQAVSDGDERAESIARALAEQVFEATQRSVRLAMQVLRGGPLAIRTAVELAGDVLRDAGRESAKETDAPRRTALTASGGSRRLAKR